MDESETFTFEPIAPEPAEDIAEPQARRRGRPPGSKNQPKDATKQADPADAPKRRKRKIKPDDINAAAKRLIGMHAMLAAFTGVPEFQLSEMEAVMLAESGLQVQREYDFEISGRLAVTLTFVATLGIVYVPRVRAMAERARKRKEDAYANATIVESSASE